MFLLLLCFSVAFFVHFSFDLTCLKCFWRYNVTFILKISLCSALYLYYFANLSLIWSRNCMFILKIKYKEKDLKKMLHLKYLGFFELLLQKERAHQLLVKEAMARGRNDFLKNKNINRFPYYKSWGLGKVSTSSWHFRRQIRSYGWI